MNLAIALGLGWLTSLPANAGTVGRSIELGQFAEMDRLPHGIAGDHRLIFVTQPLDGRVAVLDRASGVEVGELASKDGFLYFGGTCAGGIRRVPVAVFDDERAPWDRATDIEIVSPRPDGEPFDTLKGLTFNRWDPQDDALYAADPFRLCLVRIDVGTGERTVLAEDPVLLNFPVSMKFLPPVGGRRSLMVSSDQEHRFAPLNAALSSSS